MFLYQLKTALTLALRQVFTATYPVADFANLPVTIEFPYTEQEYPGVWVTWEPVGAISRGGIDNYQMTPWAPTDLASNPNDLFRYRFSGNSLFTVGALTSLQRDRLHDELLRVFLVSTDPSVESFRQYVEDNPYIAMQMDFDNVNVRGMSENPGTPWGTNDFIYECTLAIETYGEFIADRELSQLVVLSQINSTGTPAATATVTFPSSQVDYPLNLQGL